MTPEFVRLPEIERAAIIALMNSPSVRRHLPLASARFGDAECEAFVAAKERIWAEHGYGPWGFVADGTFIGWGGPQPQDDDIDIGIVLHRHAWGLGERIHREIIRRTFVGTDRDSVTVLLPPSRGRAPAMLRLGYVPDGDVWIDDQRFLRYRLWRASGRHLNGWSGDLR